MHVAPLQGTLEINLLGSFHIQGEKGPLRLTARKEQSLLAFLLLHPQSHTREKLAALLWGDSPGPMARDSLRTALKDLRRHISSDLFLTDRELVQLNPDLPFRVDVREFQQVADEKWQRATDRLAVSRIETAISQYRGDLLTDFDDDWIGPTREYYRTLYHDLLLHLTQIHRTAGEYDRAMAAARQLLNTDPANERAHQHLMFFHLVLGDRTAALQQYQECVQALQTDLAVEPSHETTALYEWIRQDPSERSALAAQLTNLPIPPSSFVGRTRELGQLRHRLTTDRLLTLTGAGGSGKTRLAIQVATELMDQFADGVWWLDLAPVMDERLVPHVAARVLGVSEPPGFESGALTKALKQVLREKKALLIFDNCEHLIAACAHLAHEILNDCAGVKILATSRQALGIFGERIYQVPTFSLPPLKQPTLSDLLLEYEGVRLFVERASAANARFALTDQNASAVLEICHRLDGIPLALELAAACCRMLSVHEIAARLHDRFELLTQGSRTAMPRHQTLRATIEWSFNLLTESERVLFRRFAVFAGGFTLDAAQLVCGGESVSVLDDLAHLVDKSLVLAENLGTETRYRLLETIREYAAERLGMSQETEQLRDRHADYYFRMAMQAHEQEHSLEAARWFERLEREHDNLRAALDWLLGQGDAESMLQFTYVLEYFWQTRGFRSEGRTWVQRALGIADFDTERSTSDELGLWAQALRSIGIFAYAEYDLTGAQANLYSSLELYQTVAKRRELNSREKVDLCTVYNYLGFTTYYQGEYKRAAAHYQNALRLYQEMGGQVAVGIGFTYSMLGRVAICRGEYGQAIEYGESSTAMGREFGQRHLTAAGLDVIGRASFYQGDLERGLPFLESSLALSREMGNHQDIADMLNVLALLHFHQGNSNAALERIQESLQVSRTLNHNMGIACSKMVLAQIALAERKPRQAAPMLKSSLEILRQIELNWHLARCIELAGELALLEGNMGRAARLFGAARTAREALGAPLPTCERTGFERVLQEAQTQLGAEQFGSAYEEGCELVGFEDDRVLLDRAIAYALRDPETP